jgi:type IV secretory pathway VirB2 component (pilin)
MNRKLNKKTLKKFHRLFLSVTTVCVLIFLCLPAIAAADDNPFSMAGKKIESGTNYLTSISRVLFILVVVVVGIGTMFGNFRKELAVKVIVGAIIVASATEIGNFFLK